MKQHKQSIRPTNDSERSPAVHYANWKETIFLQKKLATLNKTERGLVHRITVDQKVIFRRFQNKLMRSKIAQARVSNNKDQLMELRGQNMRKLHSESHLCNQGDIGFLEKLERNLFDVNSLCNGKLTGKSRNKLSSQRVTDEDMTSLIQAVMKNEPIEQSPNNLRRLSTIGDILKIIDDRTQPLDNATEEKISIIHRPTSTGNIPYKQVNREHLDNIGTKSFTDVSLQSTNNLDVNEQLSTKMSHDKQKENNLATKTADSILYNSFQTLSTNEEQEERNNYLDLSVLENTDKKKCDKQSDQLLSTLLPLRERGKTLSIQSTHAPPMMRTKKTSIFEEVKRPDMCGMRLQNAKKIDFSNKVRDFIEGLSTFGQGVPDFDYYAGKMQTDAVSQVKNALLDQVPPTPEEVYRKHTGDQTISCITMPKVNLRKGEECDYGGDFILPVFPVNNIISLSDSSSSVSEDVD